MLLLLDNRDHHRDSNRGHRENREIIDNDASGGDSKRSSTSLSESIHAPNLPYVNKDRILSGGSFRQVCGGKNFFL